MSDNITNNSTAMSKELMSEIFDKCNNILFEEITNVRINTESGKIELNVAKLQEVIGVLNQITKLAEDLASHNNANSGVDMQKRMQEIKTIEDLARQPATKETAIALLDSIKEQNKINDQKLIRLPSINTPPSWALKHGKNYAKIALSAPVVPAVARSSVLTPSNADEMPAILSADLMESDSDFWIFNLMITEKRPHTWRIYLNKDYLLTECTHTPCFSAIQDGACTIPNCSFSHHMLCMVPLDLNIKFNVAEVSYAKFNYTNRSHCFDAIRCFNAFGAVNDTSIFGDEKSFREFNKSVVAQHSDLLNDYKSSKGSNNSNLSQIDREVAAKIKTHVKNYEKYEWKDIRQRLILANDTHVLYFVRELIEVLSSYGETDIMALEGSRFIKAELCDGGKKFFKVHLNQQVEIGGTNAVLTIDISGHVKNPKPYLANLKGMEDMFQNKIPTVDLADFFILFATSLNTIMKIHLTHDPDNKAAIVTANPGNRRIKPVGKPVKPAKQGKSGKVHK